MDASTCGCDRFGINGISQCSHFQFYRLSCDGSAKLQQMPRKIWGTLIKFHPSIGTSYLLADFKGCHSVTYNLVMSPAKVNTVFDIINTTMT